MNAMTVPPKTTEPPKPEVPKPQEPHADLVSRYADQLVGDLRCFNRTIVHGTLVDVAYPGALLVSMKAAGFCPRDLARFAQPIHRQIQDCAVALAREHGIEIEMLERKSKDFRQEDRIAAILKQRGTRPGLVHIFAVKESATVFDTRHARADGYAQVITRRGSCIHYYFYWIHPQLGLIHVRVPTWLPLRLQIYFNGHSWLARQLDQAAISYEMADHAFARCADWSRAQALAEGLNPKDLHALFDELAQTCCPAVRRFASGYHWCLTAGLRLKHSAARRQVIKLGLPEHDAQGRSYRGFNPFLEEDAQILETVLRGEYALGGLTARRLSWQFPKLSRGRITRLLKRLRWHGLLRKIGHTYTYYVTALGQRLLMSVLQLKEQIFVAELGTTRATA